MVGWIVIRTETPLRIADTEDGGSSSVISAFGMVSSMFDSGTSVYSKLSTDLLSKPSELMRDRCCKRRNMLWLLCE